MTAETGNEAALPEALVEQRRRVSLVWLIPLVALLSAVWLGYRAHQQQGLLITIAFQSAEGLEAGKTRLRHKSVDVGTVESVELSGDLSRVVVQARLDRGLDAYLNENARFWVVRPRLSRGEVSGLGTLVAGTYIGVDMVRGGRAVRRFEGLESPPIVTAAESGRGFTLSADSLGSLSVGSPVHYRGVEVGRVTAFALREPDGLDIGIFIDAPHDQKVNSQTRFWNVSGFSLSMDASGVRVDTESLATMLLGGIAFGQPPDADADAAGVVEENARFRLHASEETATLIRSPRQEEWVLEFGGSVRGLLPGAPVEFRGIRVGEVLDVRLELDADSGARIPVRIGIEPAHFGGMAGRSHDRAVWDGLVRRGLRAQLKTANLVTGALFVDLDFYPDDAPREIAWTDANPAPRLPTVPAALDELRALLARLSRLPLDSMGEDLAATLATMSETMHATNGLLRRLDRETASELDRTLSQTRKTLAGLEKLLAPNSPLQSEAYRALRELAEAARSFRIMADYLERHPEALIRGKGVE